MSFTSFPGSVTVERQEEINNATPENPVHLAKVEYEAMREQYKHRFQQDVGAGRFTIPAEDGSPAAKVFELNDKGMNNAAIAHELGVSENVVRRTLRRVQA